MALYACILSHQTDISQLQTIISQLTLSQQRIFDTYQVDVGKGTAYFDKKCKEMLTKEKWLELHHQHVSRLAVLKAHLALFPKLQTSLTVPETAMASATADEVMAGDALSDTTEEASCSYNLVAPELGQCLLRQSLFLANRDSISSLCHETVLDALLKYYQQCTDQDGEGALTVDDKSFVQSNSVHVRPDGASRVRYIRFLYVAFVLQLGPSN